eukprot:g1113.t2
MRSRIVKATKQRTNKSKKTSGSETTTRPVGSRPTGCTGGSLAELSPQTSPVSDASGEMASKSPKEHRKGTILNPDLIDTTPSDEHMKKLRSREIESMHQRAIVANLSRTNCGKQASKSKLGNRIGMINQPKKGF